MKLQLTNALPIHLYQEGHQRLTVTGKQCPECKRIFDNTLSLRGHRQAMHGVPDPQIAVERKKANDRERQRKKYLKAKAKLRKEATGR